MNHSDTLQTCCSKCSQTPDGLARYVNCPNPQCECHQPAQEKCDCGDEIKTYCHISCVCSCHKQPSRTNCPCGGAFGIDGHSPECFTPQKLQRADWPHGIEMARPVEVKQEEGWTGDLYSFFPFGSLCCNGDRCRGTCDDDARVKIKALMFSAAIHERRRVLDVLDEYFKGLIFIPDPKATLQSLRKVITSI